MIVFSAYFELLAQNAKLKRLKKLANTLHNLVSKNEKLYKQNIVDCFSIVFKFAQLKQNLIYLFLEFCTKGDIFFSTYKNADEFCNLNFLSFFFFRFTFSCTTIIGYHKELLEKVERYDTLKSFQP